MAQRTQIVLEDDLDGGPAEETLQFGLDGRQYEIDLNRANAEKLREALHPFVSSGRRGQTKQTRVAGPRTAATGNPETAKIRAWAQENGHKVSDRGRIPQEILQAYHTATG